MKIRLTARNVALSERLRVHVRGRLALALGRFGERIEKVSVRFTDTVADADGRHGPSQKHCRIEVGLHPRAVSVEDEDADPFTAADGATDRLSRSVARALDREQDENQRAARPAGIQAMTVAFAERLTVVDELMGTLELVTRAGQQHVMNRILSILRGEILSLGFPLATADLASLLDAMRELEHEAGRIAPTAAAFNLHARVITGVLAKI